MNESVKTIARINGVDIVVFENDEKHIAIRPICDALGIASNKQIEKIKEHPILSSVGTLRVSTGADGKTYEMYSIPYRFVFGWLFTIDSRNVKPEAQESVLKYQTRCYNILADYFEDLEKFEKEKNARIERQLQIVELAKTGYASAHNILRNAERQLKLDRIFSFEEYRNEKRQLTLPFEDALFVEPVQTEEE